MTRERKRNGQGAWRGSHFIQGLVIILFAGVFVVVGVRSTITDVHIATTWEPTQGTVVSVEGGTVATGQVRAEYTYVAAGAEMRGKAEAFENDRLYASLAELSPGRTLPVWYDPEDPSDSRLSVKPGTMGLAAILFVVPFLLVGLSHLVRAVRGRGLWATSQDESAPPGGWRFVVLAILCCFGNVGVCMAVEEVDFPWNLLLIALYGLGVIPLVMLVVIRLHHWWTGRRRKTRPAAKTIEADSPEEAGDDDDSDSEDEDSDEGPSSPPPPMASLARKMALPVIFTVIWCGIVGLAAFFAVSAIVQGIRAGDWPQAMGQVVFSRVKTAGSGEDTRYKPLIRYRYFVAGRSYESDRYSFDGFVDEGYRAATRIVANYPAEQFVIVYYDPEDPSLAVLNPEIPGGALLGLYFLQPFLLAGAGLLWWTLSVPLCYVRLKRFLNTGAEAPWRIPGWGVLDDSAEGLTIRRRSCLKRVLLVAAFGYGITCIGTVALAVVIYGLADLGGDPVPLLIGGPPVAALIAGVWTWLRFRRAATVTFDLTQRILTVRGPNREDSVRFSEIRSWRVRNIPYRGGIAVNNVRTRYVMLELTTNDGRLISVHAFRPSAAESLNESSCVIRHAAQEFARLTGSGFRETEVDAPSGPSISSGLGVLRATLRMAARDANDDLT